MPEGDTIFRAAGNLRKALLDQVITGFESSVPQVQAVAARTPVVGRVTTAVEPRGKHLLMVFSLAANQAPTDLVLHTHMRMTGSWHIYRPGERWRKPTYRAVVVLHTAELIVPCFSAPIVALLTAAEVARHPDLNALGPDAITEDFDAAEALRRLRLRASLPIGVALLDQRAFSGVGNVFKSEVLFLQRVSPWARVADLPDDTLARVIDEAHRQLRRNRHGGGRDTVGALGGPRLFVYGRSSEPCRTCGATVRMRRQGDDLRSTYYCPACQGVL